MQFLFFIYLSMMVNASIFSGEIGEVISQNSVNLPKQWGMVENFSSCEENPTDTPSSDKLTDRFILFDFIDKDKKTPTHFHIRYRSVEKDFIAIFMSQEKNQQIIDVLNERKAGKWAIIDETIYCSKVGKFENFLEIFYNNAFLPDEVLDIIVKKTKILDFRLPIEDLNSLVWILSI